MAHKTDHSHHNNNIAEYFKTHKLQPDVPHEIKSHLTFGQRAADIVTKFCGTWTFIFILFIFIAVWMGLNVYALVSHWDPWPFIILNLILSCLATVQAPIILMSQNRANERDRKRADYDYHINRRAERGIAEIQHDLAHIKYVLAHIYHKKK
jgi:uncharacterized membrane protein